MTTFTKDDKQLLGNIRQKLNDAFNYCLKNKYDARPLVEAWERFISTAQSIGMKPESKPHHKVDYWNDPETYANQANNKNPIIRVTEDFEIIRKKDLAKASRGTSRCDIGEAHGSLKRDIINTKNNDEMQPRRTTIEHKPRKPVQPYYYKVNISWVERDNTPKDVIDEICEFMKGAGLEPVSVHDFNNGYEIEKTAEFKMQGGEESFRWVKRCIMSHLERFVGGIPEFNIAISGRKYEDFEMTK
ncbi:MAG: hypothetical protein HDS66_01130 [Bacteroidales bacterium]|nr:hypothetical protein [Bacteroidales bacterium]